MEGTSQAVLGSSEERKVPVSLSPFMKSEKIPALLYVGKGPEYILTEHKVLQFFFFQKPSASNSFILQINKNPKPAVINKIKWLPNAGLEGLDQMNIQRIYKGLRLLSSQIMPNGTHKMPLYNTFWMKICRNTF
jgi:hypothetical protein